MEHDKIRLLQFMVCKDFEIGEQDSYTANLVRSNLHVPSFPYYFEDLYAVTCWRKDKMFHKEVIEYTTGDGRILKTPPMDIEPITSSVLFRWHKHAFPKDLEIREDGLIHIRVILDWKVNFESYLMIEKRPAIS